MALFNFFSAKSSQSANTHILVDMHSHILPGIDDGAASLDDSLQLIQHLREFGYKKLITTPHIMGDFFKNTPEIIFEKLSDVREMLKKNSIDFQIEAAAEYYLDEWFMDSLRNGKELLSFGDKYVLFETSYINSPSFLQEAIFLMKSLGYKPVLAHPERYTYLYGDFKNFIELYEKEVLFQVNLNSFTGYYSSAAKSFAEKLLKSDMIDFTGTDCHGIRHIEALRKVIETKAYNKLTSSKILNNTLL